MSWLLPHQLTRMAWTLHVATHVLPDAMKLILLYAPEVALLLHRYLVLFFDSIGGFYKGIMGLLNLVLRDIY